MSGCFVQRPAGNQGIHLVVCLRGSVADYLPTTPAVLLMGFIRPARFSFSHPDLLLIHPPTSAARDDLGTAAHYFGTIWTLPGLSLGITRTSWTMLYGLLVDYFWTSGWSHWDHSELCGYYWRSVPLLCGKHMAIFLIHFRFCHPVWNAVSLTFLWQGLMRSIWRDKSAIWLQLP